MATAKAHTLLSLLFFSFQASSTPLSDSSSHLAQLLRRTAPCDPGQIPILYTKEYRAEDCPPAIVMNKDGSCPIKVSACASYCEVHQNFYYGQEVPLDNGFCHGPLTCTITSTNTKTYTYNGGANVGATIAKVFNIGVTGGYSSAEAITDTRTTSINLQQNQCGYFTFLPILHDSCGSLTQGQYVGGPEICIKPSTSGNVCSTQPYRTADGKNVLGDTIFVYTDCGTHERLPSDKQDPAYNHDGVAQPQNAFTTFSQQWDCTLSSECQQPEGVAINPACTCKCAGQLASLNQAGCAGFKGSLPNPPGPQPGNGP